MFGYGRSNGESHPVSRTGVTLLVVGVAPGPWAGRTPKITQTDYVTKATALPQDIQKKATEGSDSTPINILKNNDEDTASNKSTVKKAVIVKSSGRRRH